MLYFIVFFFFFNVRILYAYTSILLYTTYQGRLTVGYFYSAHGVFYNLKKFSRIVKKMQIKMRIYNINIAVIALCYNVRYT